MIGLPWSRRDWSGLVGHAYGVESQYVESVVKGQPLNWYFATVERLELSHRAALLVLSGAKISQVLLPNMSLVGFGGFHVLLASVWSPYRAPPALTGLKFATLEGVPAEIPDLKVLEVLAQYALGH